MLSVKKILKGLYLQLVLSIKGLSVIYLLNVSLTSNLMMYIKTRNLTVANISLKGRLTISSFTLLNSIINNIVILTTYNTELINRGKSLIL